MGAHGAEGLLRDLEARLAGIAADGEPVRLAFSGGIASLLLAALIRKRADVDCIVVGIRGAPDLRTAADERLYLDYGVTEVCLSPGRALALGRGLARRFPSWSVPEILDAVPLEAVRARLPDVSIVAGLRGPLASRRTAAAFFDRGFSCPFLAPPAIRADRSRLVQAARALALPQAFVRTPPRRPAIGSGVAAALRAVGREKNLTMARLLRP